MYYVVYDFNTLDNRLKLIEITVYNFEFDIKWNQNNHKLFASTCRDYLKINHTVRYGECWEQIKFNFNTDKGLLK